MFSVTEKVAFIERAFGKGNLERSGHNINVRCPIPECTSRRDRAKKKLAIRVADDANHCWVCGFRARSLLPLLFKYSSRDLVDKYVERFYVGPQSRTKLATIDSETHKVVTLPLDFRPTICASSDPDARAVLRYMTARSIDERAAWLFKFGTSDEPRWRRRLLMPSFDSCGKLNFFVGRAIDSRIRPKYDNPTVPAHEIIFNELNVDWSRRLVLCEGPLDLVRCGDNATCLLGSALSEVSLLFDRLLQHQTPVALALDTDAKFKTMKIAKLLTRYGIDVVIVSMGKHNDPGEMTREEFSEALVSAKKWTWEEMLSMKLDRLQTNLGFRC